MRHMHNCNYFPLNLFPTCMCILDLWLYQTRFFCSLEDAIFAFLSLDFLFPLNFFLASSLQVVSFLQLCLKADWVLACMFLFYLLCSVCLKRTP